MYERLLDKQKQPTFEEMIDYCGDSGVLWIALENYLQAEFDATRQIRFPYGKDYGWGAKYSRKSKHICDVFAENGAFTVLFQVSSDAVDMIYDEMDAYAKEAWVNKYPCSSGGWVNFRILNEAQLESAKKVICARVKPRKK